MAEVPHGLHELSFVASSSQIEATKRKPTWVSDEVTSELCRVTSCPPNEGQAFVAVNCPKFELRLVGVIDTVSTLMTH